MIDHKVTSYATSEDMWDDLEQTKNEGIKIAKEIQYQIEKHPVLSVLYADLKAAYKEKNKKAIRMIGEKLNEIGGFELMQYFCNSFYPSFIFNELNYDWNNIGEWQA